MSDQAAVELADLRLLRTAVRGDIVSCEDWNATVDLAQASEQANQLLLRAEDEAESIRTQAFEEGFASGLEQARQTMSQELLEVNHRKEALVAESEQQITELALAVVERLMPSLGAEKLLPALVQEAMAEAQACRFLKVRINPAAVGGLTDDIEQLRHVMPTLESLEVVADGSVEEYACVLESELGEVRAAIPTQLAAIRKTLLDSSSMVSE